MHCLCGFLFTLSHGISLNLRKTQVKIRFSKGEREESSTEGMFAEKFQSVPDSPGELSLLKISVSCISRSDVWPGTLCLNIYLKSLIQMVPKQLPWLHSQIHTSTSHFLTPVNPVSLLDLSCRNDSCIKSDLAQSAGNLLPS